MSHGLVSPSLPIDILAGMTTLTDRAAAIAADLLPPLGDR